MSNNNSTWRIVGESVRGASHERTNLPNQDAIQWSPERGDALPLILSVSDGHGSARYFRSDVGSRLAVDTAVEVIKEFLDGQADINNLSIIKRTAEEKLTQALAHRWREAVSSDIEARAFTPDEMGLLKSKAASAQTSTAGEDKDSPVSAEDTAAFGYLAYGATLLCVVVTADYILYLQLGDGDILTVTEKGEVTKPLAADARLFANETTSLCSRDGWRDFRVGFQVMSGEPPALILLSTDGYANSFRDEAGFLKVGSDLLDMIRTDGLESISDNLEIWLAEASQAGSGDDITLGLICRMDALAKVENHSAVVTDSVKANAEPSSDENADATVNESVNDMEE
jgi:serine/threonine protein phosphatase PrpC